MIPSPNQEVSSPDHAFMSIHLDGPWLLPQGPPQPHLLLVEMQSCGGPWLAASPKPVAGLFPWRSQSPTSHSHWAGGWQRSGSREGEWKWWQERKIKFENERHNTSNMTMRIMMMMMMCVCVYEDRTCVWSCQAMHRIMSCSEDVASSFFLLQKIHKELARRHQHACPHMLIACLFVPG